MSMEPLFSDGYNLISDSSAAIGFSNGIKNDQVGTVGNPMNPLLGLLADNGGPNADSQAT